MPIINVHQKGCLQGPLGQSMQATGCIHRQGGCCLWLLHTGPPWGKKEGQLQKIKKRARILQMDGEDGMETVSGLGSRQKDPHMV